MSAGERAAAWLRRLWDGFARSPVARRGRPLPDDDEPSEEPAPAGDVAVLPLEDTLDLHHFAPRDVPSVVDEYLRAAREAGLAEVTVVHGRGKGVQRQVVRRILEAHPAVASFAAATGARATGATVVRLRRS